LVPGKDGIRFRLKYITTTLRDGFELAQILQYFLRKVGIELEIDMTETGVFFDRIKKGQFDLYSSRWIGVADASILRRALHSKSPLNRIHYHSPAMDQLIEDRKVQEAQKLMLADLPYSPLWTWKSCIVETNDRFPFSEENFSRSGALDVLGKIYVSFDHDSTHSRSKSSGQSNSKPNP
jgi:ABC-type transport system substrate-binding protein